MTVSIISSQARPISASLEDELYEYALAQRLSRHLHDDLAKIVRDYGTKDDFRISK